MILEHPRFLLGFVLNPSWTFSWFFRLHLVSYLLRLAAVCICQPKLMGVLAVFGNIALVKSKVLMCLPLVTRLHLPAKTHRSFRGFRSHCPAVS